jgi:hypothetical protein
MFIKISVAVTLLRIAFARPVFQWALWAVIAATVIAALVFIVGIANICMYGSLHDQTLLIAQVIQSALYGARPMAHAIFN